jgi:hypothetical protein
VWLAIGAGAGAAATAAVVIGAWSIADPATATPGNPLVEATIADAACPLLVAGSVVLTTDPLMRRMLVAAGVSIAGGAGPGAATGGPNHAIGARAVDVGPRTPGAAALFAGAPAIETPVAD